MEDTPLFYVEEWRAYRFICTFEIVDAFVIRLGISPCVVGRWTGN
jgi:hypothetical protein